MKKSRNRMLAARALLFAVCAGSPVAAQPVLPALDPKIVSVSSGGTWRDDGMEGTFRVVLWSEGFEHVSSGVVAQWVVGPLDSNEPAMVVHSEVLVAPGLMMFRRLGIARTKVGLRVTLDGVHTYESARRVSCRFHLLADRKVRPDRRCG